MAATMTSIAIAADAWTSIYSAESGVTIGLQNVSEHDNMLVRIDANAGTSDDATAPADILAPHEHRTYTLASGDKVFGRPYMPGKFALVANLRTP
jgi:hypothetical protein